jgi:transcriptional repressor NrdR
MLFVSYLYSIDDMKSKKSDNNSKKKNTTNGNKKTSVLRRRRDTDKDRTMKTRQQQVSKTKTKASKSKQQEQQQQQELLIKRSSGRKEKFDTNRMAQTVGRSGVPFLMARDVAKTVSNKIKHEAQQQAKGRRSSSNKSKPTQLKEKTVTASRIRNLVSNELRDRNRSDIAASYSGQTPENTLSEQNLKDNQPTLADTSATNRNRVLHDQSKRGGGIMT